MSKVKVKPHTRRGRHGNGRVRGHLRTHRVRNGRKEVFVDGFWKHDDYPNAPKSSWSTDRLLRERRKLATDLDEGIRGIQGLPARKFGLLTRRIRRIDRMLKGRNDVTSRFVL